MSNIIKSDPYMEFYMAHKTVYPEDKLMLRAFRQKDVDDVDKLLQISRGNRELVKTEKDWGILNELIVFYIRRWPEEWMEFRGIMPDIRETRNPSGYSNSKEIKYIGAMPPRLMKLIKVIFPRQQWNKKFANQFIKRCRAFQVAGWSN